MERRAFGTIDQNPTASAALVADRVWLLLYSEWLGINHLVVTARF
jgi:uncharacterized membrane protein YccF (DUF307 family)